MIAEELINDMIQSSFLDPLPTAIRAATMRRICCRTNAFARISNAIRFVEVRVNVADSTCRTVETGCVALAEKDAKS